MNRVSAAEWAWYGVAIAGVIAITSVWGALGALLTLVGWAANEMLVRIQRADTERRAKAPGRAWRHAEEIVVTTGRGEGEHVVARIDMNESTRR